MSVKESEIFTQRCGKCEELSFFTRIVASQRVQLEKVAAQPAPYKGTRNSWAAAGCLTLLPRLHRIGRRVVHMHVGNE